MLNALKLAKEVFTVGVVVTSIVWSLGVAALVPGVANAATDSPVISVNTRASDYLNRCSTLRRVYLGTQERTYADYYTPINSDCFTAVPGPSSQPMF